jgi:hypothetical protein
MQHGGHDNPMVTGSPSGGCEAALTVVSRHGGDHHGAGKSMGADIARARLDDPGAGLRDAPWRVLTYAVLRRAHRGPSGPPPGREIELHLTGNMERYTYEDREA